MFIYEKPVDQQAFHAFLEGQPVIDVHVHVSKGFEGSALYGEGLPAGPKLDQAKLEWFQEELDRNTIVIALSGGPVPHVLNWTKQDDRIWGGVTFPYNEHLEQDETFTKAFLSYEELFPLYDSLGFKSMDWLTEVQKRDILLPQCSQNAGTKSG